MKQRALGLAVAVSALSIAAQALAASDYYLKFDGVDGESAATVDIQSWSWGASNSNAAATGRVVTPGDPATGQASGKRTAGLRESPTKSSLGRPQRAAAGDLDGDGRPELVAVADQREVENFSLTLDGSSPLASRLCANGKHIAKAELRARGETFVLENATVAGCTAAGETAAEASRDMPNRISMNVTVPKQTQGATFGERCAAGQCTDGSSITLKLTGQMRHTKTGHVTLLK